MKETCMCKGWRELLHDSARRWQILWVLTCLSVLLPIPLWPVLALWGVHDWLMARESSSRAVKTAAYVVLAVVSVLFLVDFFHCVSIFL